jgi:hypothetical protein
LEIAAGAVGALGTAGAGEGDGAGVDSGGPITQPVSAAPTAVAAATAATRPIAAHISARPALVQGNRIMWLIVVEMLLALGLAIFIVWWTMFHRSKPPQDKDSNGKDSDKIQ